MDFQNPSFIKSDGLRIATYVDGPLGGPVVILIHGWPELAYSWKTTIPPLVEAGYRVVTYDLRGFGASDTPRGVEHYAIEQMVADLEAVINSQTSEKVTLIGHDWGGIILWHAARMIADRIQRIVSICTPHVKHAPVDPLKIFRKRFGEDHYFIEFNHRPEEIESLFARDPDAFFRLMFRTTPRGQEMDKKFTYIPKNFATYLLQGAPDLPGPVMSDKDRNVYTRAYKHSGFHGGMSLYRNTTHNWELAKAMSEKVFHPALMLSPEDDLLLPPSSTDHMPEIVPNLTRKIIPNCGHWAMWDNPDGINKAIIDWLGLAPTKA
ncbi:alpha/beta fold hydrolase [Litorimonas haliclonae]|uniref:alpha/beta fold hydrolase n=1 Tax=Litorimonas haliclonae TaxID=2081977 RepID=UPI0039EF924E